MYISVIGQSRCSEETYKTAYEVGELIARKGAILVCGGLGGVMEAAAKGAKEACGLTVGILPSNTRVGASKYLGVALPTDLGQARNVLVVLAGDAVIAIGGEFGTLSEIGLALKFSKPVIGLKTWELSKDKRSVEAVNLAETPEEAVDKAFKLAQSDF